ncbi:unnamed protein product [Ectocarpus fasciculatus]
MQHENLRKIAFGTTVGAEKNAKNARGFTPLHAAAASNKTGTISLLLAAGADINLASRDQQ